MAKSRTINRRQFLQATTLVAAAASTARAAEPRRQLNNTAGQSLKPVRLGCIGVGIRGTQLIEAAAGISGVRVVAVADCYKGHLARTQELLNPPPATTGDYTELLARADVDAVLIATPDHWHLKMAQDALAAGKHVYVEKPMAHTWEQGETLVAGAEKSGKVVQVGSQYMSMGCARQVADFVKSGRLGNITLIDGRIHRNSATGAWYYPIPPDASPETVDWKRFLGPAPARDFDLRRFFQWRLFWDYSGGLPTDLFVHLVTAVHQVMGVQEPQSGFSFGDIYHWKNYREVPDQMTSMVTYPEGFVLRLSSTSGNSHPGPLLTIYGSEGTIEYNGGSFTHYHQPPSDNFGYSTHSWPKATTAAFKELMNLNDNLAPVDGPSVAPPVEYRSPNDEDSTRAHIRNWIETIRTGGQAIEHPKVGHHAALVGHMCNLSFKAGRPLRWNKTTRKVEG